MSAGYTVKFDAPNIDDFKLERPLASSLRYQSFFATKDKDPFRIVRFLRTDDPSEADLFAATIASIRRSILVSHKGVLPISIVEDSPNALVTSTPYVHAQNLSTRNPTAEESLAIFLAVAESVASSHRIGVAHSRLMPSNVYWTLFNSLMRTHQYSSVLIDLLDGLLVEDQTAERSGAIALADDVDSLGSLMHDMLIRSSPTSPFEAIRPLIMLMRQRKWIDRPSIEEVILSLHSCIALQQTGSVDLSMRSGLSVNDATQEIPAFAVEAMAKEQMIPGHMPQIGRFSIERSLGEGGMGAVFLGRDRGNDQLVAIKVLSARMAKDEKATRRFAKEARLMSTVAHPAIAQLIEFNRSGDTMYLAMEYVPGGSLADYTRLQQPLNESLVVSAIADAARGLNVAHQIGMCIATSNPLTYCSAHEGNAHFNRAQSIRPEVSH